MTEQATAPQNLTLDGVEYPLSSLTEEQKMLLNHVADLDNKLAAQRFQLDQLQVARNAFFGMLKNALEAPKAE